MAQHDDLRAGEVALEVDRELGVGATEGVDDLVVVGDRGEARAVGNQQPHQRELRLADVVELIDQERLDVGPPALGDRLAREHHRGGVDDALEVKRVGRAQLLLVVVEGLRHAALAAHLPKRGVLEVGLGSADPPHQLGGVDLDLRALQRRAGDPQLIVGVKDREAGVEADHLGVAADDLGGEGVDRGDPHPAFARGQARLDSRCHLGGGSVGEGDRHHLAGRSLSGADQMDDPLRQDSGLTGAGAGDDEQRARQLGRHGRRLVGIELARLGRGRRDCQWHLTSSRCRVGGRGVTRSRREARRAGPSRKAPVPRCTRGGL